jgi:hypothetical protein
MTNLATTTTAHNSVHVSPHAVALAVGAVGIYLGWLWVKARLFRGHLGRAVSRAYSPASSGRRPPVRSEHRMVARTTRSRKADRQFRKALLISALITAAVVFVHLHPHTH